MLRSISSILFKRISCVKYFSSSNVASHQQKVPHVYNFLEDISKKDIDSKMVFENHLKKIIENSSDESSIIHFLNSAKQVLNLDLDSVKDVLSNFYSTKNQRINFWIIQSYCDQGQVSKAIEYKSSLSEDRINYFFPLLNGYIQEGYDNELVDLIQSTKPKENIFSNFEILKGYICSKNHAKFMEELPFFLEQAKEYRNLIFTLFHLVAENFDYKESAESVKLMMKAIENRIPQITFICTIYNLLNKEKFRYVYTLNKNFGYRASDEYYKIIMNHPKVIENPRILINCMNLKFPPNVLNKFFKSINKKNQNVLKFLDSYLKDDQILEKYINFLTLDKNYQGLVDLIGSVNGSDKYIYPFVITELRETGFDMSKFILDLDKNSSNNHSKAFFITQYLWYMSFPQYITSIVTDFLVQEKLFASIIFRRVNNLDHLRNAKRRIRKIQNSLPDDLAVEFLNSLKTSYATYKENLDPNHFLRQPDTLTDDFFIHKPRSL